VYVRPLRYGKAIVYGSRHGRCLMALTGLNVVKNHLTEGMHERCQTSSEKVKGHI
jgi:hypothetical protein